MKPVSATPVVLVVDDEELNRMPLAALLQSEGYRVLEAESGIQTLDIINCTPVDLILLDVMMPDMDGFTTCEHIRRHEAFLTLPIIFATALGDRESRVRGKAVGADDFLTKPVDPVELVIRVRNLLKLKAYSDLQREEKRSLEAALQQAHAQLFHADRLANLGTMVASIGHELQSACGILNATLDFVGQDIDRGIPIKSEDLNNLHLVRTHLRNHAMSLLEMGRPGLEMTSEFDLNVLIEQTVELLHATGKTKRIQIAIEPPDTPVTLNAVKSRIQQVLINLICNATDALMEIAGDRRLIIRVIVDPENRLVRVSISNNGPPIPTELRERIFEPFYTTKTENGGTGLGLSVVRQLVSAHGGRINAVTSNNWTTFHLELPLDAKG